MYYFYLVGGVDDELILPVTPSKLNIKINNQNKIITLINEGEINLIKSPGLTDIQIDRILLPMLQEYPFAIYHDGFKQANYFLDRFEKWKLAKKPITLNIIRETPSGQNLSFDTSHIVTIEDYTITEDAENGQDVVVSLNLKQYVAWGAKKLVVKAAKKVTTTKKTRVTKQPAKTYTIKSGDTLYGIARKQLNNAAKWKSIYTLNKSVIENAAKRRGRKSSSNGHWIYPGTKIKLPS